MRHSTTPSSDSDNPVVSAHTRDTADMEGRASFPQGCNPLLQWHLLPPELLCLVFRQLKDKDRCQARLVCRAWDAVFRMPQLWRRRRFTFRGVDESEAWRACRFMECGLGAHLHHLTVEVGMPVVQNARKIAMAVEQFLKVKQNGMRLKTFSCSGLEYFQSPLYRIAIYRLKMVRALCAFLRRQKCLHEVDMACSQMGKDDGCRVLKALAFHGRPQKYKKQRSWLTHLDLRDFFVEDVPIGKLQVYAGELGKLAALTEIRLNFIYLNDAVLDQMVTSASSLIFIAITVDDSQVPNINHRGQVNALPTTAGWTAAVERRKALRVGVDMRGRFELNDFRSVLVPRIPVSEFSVTTLVPSVFFWPENMLSDIASVMDFLARHCANYLTSFSLCWFDSMALWEYGPQIVRLVRQCKGLRCLWVTMRMPAETAMQIASACKEIEGDYLDLRVSGFEPEVAVPPNFSLVPSR